MASILTNIRESISAIKLKWKQFRQWQRTPAKVKPMSDNRHICLNCSNKYTGSYCPRCGQASNVRRLDAKTTTRGALDVWGMGSRSMPRAIHHLLFRPGYMIADYLHGHRQPYFPPFKMLFIVTATAMLIAHFLPNGNDGAKAKQPKTEQVAAVNDTDSLKIASSVQTEAAKSTIDVDTTKNQAYAKAQIESKNSDDSEMTPEVRERLEYMKEKVSNSVNGFNNVLENIEKTNKPLSLLFTQFLLTIGMYCVFRNSPRMGRLAFTEQFYAQVLITTQLQVLSIIYMLLTLNVKSDDDFALPSIIIIIVGLIDYKQLYGFNWWKTIIKCTFAVIVNFTLYVFVFLIGSLFYYIVNYLFHLVS